MRIRTQKTRADAFHQRGLLYTGISLLLLLLLLVLYKASYILQCGNTNYIAVWRIRAKFSMPTFGSSRNEEDEGEKSFSKDDDGIYVEKEQTSG